MTVEEGKVNTSEAAEDGKRERSTIDFPYMDLSHGIAVANGIHGRVGGGSCAHDELAVALDLSPSSSGYRTRLSTARLFGLIVSDRGSEAVKLTDLGQRVVDPAEARQARAQAFLNVPLFKRLYDNYRGRVLPPAAALQRELIGIGVSGKQAERARQIMERSAELAGFFESGRDRLIMPAGVRQAAPSGEEPKEKDPGGEYEDEKKKKKNEDDGGDGPDLQLDKLLIELLKKIPPAKEGWPARQRLRWFKTFAMNVSQIYDEDSEPVELKIELEAEGVLQKG